MSEPMLPSSTRPVRGPLAVVVRGLKVGQKIRVTQKVRINCRDSWSAVTEGAFRGVSYLSTGLSTDRVPEDDIIVATVHFTKPNGELSSVSLDENSQIETIG